MKFTLSCSAQKPADQAVAIPTVEQDAKITVEKPTTKKYIYLVIAAAVAWISSMAFGGIYMSYAGDALKNRSREYDFDITPARWAFKIWWFIYLWQLCFFVYCILSIFDKFSLPKVPVAVFPMILIHSGAGAVGGVFATKFWHFSGFCSILVMMITATGCLCATIHKAKPSCCKKSMFYNIAVQNSFAILAGWLTIATLLSLGIALIQGCMKMNPTCVGTMMLGALLFKLILFCGLELSVLHQYMRYVWSHYIALVVACGSILCKNHEPTNRNTMLTVLISGFVSCAIVVKVMRMLWRK